MNKKNFLWGLLLIAVGLVWGGNALGITDIDLFFDGWWTLFIIVPCLFGLVQEKEKTGNLIGLCIGVAFLLACQGLINFELIWKLAFPVILVIVGLTVIFKNTIGERAARHFARENKGTGPAYCATFSGQNLSFVNERFEGAQLSAVFGGIKCDLNGAIIDHDVLIKADAVFGGVDIIVPSHLQVKVCSNSCFGGVSEERLKMERNGVATVYVDANCLFGGVTIK